MLHPTMAPHIGRPPKRDHLRALAQRVEVGDGEVRIMGSKSDLLRTLAAAPRSQFCTEVADGEGFEPPRGVNLCRFSRPVP